jgi:hypothetical protein
MPGAAVSGMTLTKMSLDAPCPSCESLSVTLRSTRRNNVIAFPVFEHNGDRIREWLSEIGDSPPAGRTVLRLVKSMRCRAATIERVRNSMRHRHLAMFVRHAANALEASEWDGARYLLITSLALIAGRGVTAKGFAEIPAVRQLPPAEVDELPVAAAIGIVTG